MVYSYFNTVFIPKLCTFSVYQSVYSISGNAANFTLYTGLWFMVFAVTQHMPKTMMSLCNKVEFSTMHWWTNLTNYNIV